MSRKSKVLDILSGTRRILWIFGLYHGKQFPKYALFELRRIATLGLIALLPALMLIKILLSKPDFAMLSKIITYFVSTLWVLVRVHLYIGTLPKQRAFDDLLQDDIFNMQNRRQERFISAAKKKQKYLVKYFLAFIAAFEAILILTPIVSDTNANVPIWTPFDGKKEDVIISIYEALSFSVFGVVYSIMDCNFIGLISIVTIEMKILKDNLRHATERDSQTEYIKAVRKIQERLRTCIIHHNAILDLARKLEELFAPTLFCQIVFAVQEICFLGVLITIERDRVQLLFWLCFFVVISQTMVSCWCGQTLISESSGIIEACYMSKWYNSTPYTRTTFSIIMEQAKRPITLNGGPLFRLSFDTFVKILRSAYTYYTVFRQIYNK